MTIHTTETSEQTVSILSIANNTITLLSDPTTLDFTRDGNDLVVENSDSETITVKDFFSAEEGAELPDFILADGVVISGEDFLMAQNPDLDITTAAGPSAPQSNGVNSYADDAANLLGGVTTLESLGTTDQWSDATPLATSFLSTDTPQTLVATDFTATPLPSTPLPSTPPPPAQQSFFTRAILYSDENDKYRTESIKFGLVHDGKQLDASSDAFTYSVVDPSNSGYFILPPVPGPDGLLLISLSDAGKAALAANPNALHSMLQVSIVNADHSINSTYSMEVIVEKDDTYESSRQPDFLQNDAELAFQWHTMEREGAPSDRSDPDFFDVLLKSSDGEHIYAGDGNAYISVASPGYEIIQGKTSGNMVTSGSGNDTIVIDAGSSQKDYNSTWWAGINAGDGDNTVIFKGSNVHALVTTGSGNDHISYNIQTPDAYCGLYGGSINTGAGNDTVEITSTSSGLMGVASSSVSLGSGDDVLIVKAQTSGISSTNVSLGDGNDTVLIEAGTRGFSNGTLSLGSGNDVVTITSNNIGMQGSINGESSGNKHITVAGKDYAFNDTYTNAIKTGTGNDSIFLGKGITIENDKVIFSSDAEEQGWGNLKGNVQISAGNGSDTIAIDGDVQIGKNWYDNYISTGTGITDISTSGSGTTNLLSINGNILGHVTSSNSNLRILGDAGKDTFDIKGNVDHTDIKTGDGEDLLTIGGNLSNTNINMGNGNDIVHLNNSTIDTVTTLHGGDGTDTLVYTLDTNSGSGGLQSLVDAIANNQVDGFENLVIDMTNTTNDSLLLSSILDTLHDTVGDGTNNKIFINGDSADQIDLGSGWVLDQGQTESLNNTDYNVYVNSHSNDTVYIEQTITSIIG